MATGGETADQMTRMTLQGIEVAANVALKLVVWHLNLWRQRFMLF